MNEPRLIARNFVGGPWDGHIDALLEHDQYLRATDLVFSKVLLNIGGQPKTIDVASPIHFIYELDSDGDMVCLVAGTRLECETAMARKLAEE